MQNKHLLILSSPSGGGKSTVAKFLLEKYPQFCFSVSATTRSPRPGEIDGTHYHFLPTERFKELIAEGGMAEYEEIFGNYYGTIKSKTDEAIAGGKFLLFDVDVKGALSLRKAYPETSLLMFLSPPSVEILEARLRNRGTETEEQILRRLARYKEEVEYAPKFDYHIINDKLDYTLAEVDAIILQNFNVNR